MSTCPFFSALAQVLLGMTQKCAELACCSRQVARAYTSYRKNALFLVAGRYAIGHRRRLYEQNSHVSLRVRARTRAQRVVPPSAPPYCKMGRHQASYRSSLVKFNIIIFYSEYFFSHTLTFQLLDKPWSQVSSLLPPGSCLQFLLRIHS